MPESKLPAAGRRPHPQSPGTAPLPDREGSRRSPLATLAKLVLSVAAIGACIAGGMYLAPRSSADETSHANWQRVEEATKQTQAAGKTQLAYVSAAGAASLIPEIKLDPAQRDETTTTKIVDAIKRDAPQEVAQAIVAAQQIPEVKLEATQKPLIEKPITPTLDASLTASLAQGDASFYQLYMFDSCAEDGDVIEVQINGSPFALVPITHQGATLSIPVAGGKVAAVSIRGVRDGGGGITVGFKVVGGEAFLGSIRENEVVSLGIVGG